MSVRLALWRLGLTWSDVDQMAIDMLDAIARANRDLVDSFTRR